METILDMETIAAMKAAYDPEGYDDPFEHDAPIPRTISIRSVMKDSLRINDEKEETLAEARANEQKVGSLKIRMANDWNMEAELMADPVPLFSLYWTEGEIACLFADSNVGKSILAVQIGCELAAKGKPLLYFDFELSRKQFQMRYCTDSGKTYVFPPTFMRGECRPEDLDPGVSLEDTIIEDIAAACVSNHVRHVIIDNINTLTSKGQDGEVALKLMSRLRKLKMMHDLSILVVAHTPKRDQNEPLTDNDLAGSKNLFNVFDAVFGMNKCTVNPQLRYIKQLKARSAAVKYGADNVEVMRMEKRDDGFLGLVHVKFDTEMNMLKRNKRSEEREQVLKLQSDGLTYQQIGKQLGMSTGKAHKLAHMTDPE